MEIVLALALSLLLATVSSLFVYLRMHKQVTNLTHENSELRSQKQALEAIHNANLVAAEKTQQQLSDTFHALSSAALSKNSEMFLNLAKESLQQFHIHAKNELDQKEKSVETLVKPIKDALEKTELQIRNIEKDRKESFGALSQHLQSLIETQNNLHGETRRLVQALRRPEVRGQWGEMTLKRLAELAGMVEHCDFIEQVTLGGDERRQRPDMVVKLPAGREIVIDAKTPLDAYLNAIEASDDESKQRALVQHAKQVRDRMRELASKGYWSQFKNTLDFVVLFIPGDQFLSAALDVDRSLLEDALQNRVMLATPTSLVALLRAIAYGWRQEALAENAEQIRKHGEELYKRLGDFSEHLGKIGKNLDLGVKSYNSAVGSFTSRVMPSAKRFGELGIEAAKTPIAPEQIEIISKQLDYEL